MEEVREHNDAVISDGKNFIQLYETLSLYVYDTYEYIVFEQHVASISYTLTNNNKWVLYIYRRNIGFSKPLMKKKKKQEIYNILAKQLNDVTVCDRILKLKHFKK
jgi:hypothetical protein